MTERCIDTNWLPHQSGGCLIKLRIIGSLSNQSPITKTSKDTQSHCLAPLCSLTLRFEIVTCESRDHFRATFHPNTDVDAGTKGCGRLYPSLVKKRPKDVSSCRPIVFFRAVLGGTGAATSKPLNTTRRQEPRLTQDWIWTQYHLASPILYNQPIAPITRREIYLEP